MVLKAAHPSPLSAKKFLGSKPFSAVNDALRAVGAEAHDLPLTPERILEAIEAGAALREAARP